MGNKRDNRMKINIEIGEGVRVEIAGRWVSLEEYCNSISEEELVKVKMRILLMNSEMRKRC
jgi:hypothetical protein